MNQLSNKLQNHKIDDHSLIKLCQQGDLAALDTLIVKYQDRVYNIIYKICSNSDDAAELTQDTFVKVIEKIGDFKFRSALYTWVFRVAVNLTLNFVKRRASIGFKSLDETLKSCSEDSKSTLKSYLHDGGKDDPVLIAQKKEVGEIVQSALNRLDQQHKAIMLLREVEVLSYAEISEVLDIEVGTVKSRLFRARENLKEILKEALA